MSETKQDVFDEVLDAYGDAIAGGGQGGNGHPAEYRLRYAAASDGETDCPWCHYSGLDNAVPWLPDALTGTVAGVSLYPPSLIVNVEGVNTRIPIRFCPMCGRSLGASHEPA